MQNNHLVPVPPEPPLPLLTLVSAPRAQQIEASNHVLAEALYRISKYIRVLDDGHGRRHLLWTGPVRPRTGQPMVHRWLGRKNISAHRALWEAQYGEAPYGRPRRLQECAHENCVSPQCFTTATPLEPGALPESLSRGQRVDAEGQPRANYYVAAGVFGGAPGFSGRHCFRPMAGYTLRNYPCMCGCGAEVQIPTCPLGHPIEGWVRDWSEHIGKWYRCQNCRYVLRFIQEMRSRQPRAGLKPISAARDRFDREVKQVMASIPHENTPEEAREALRRSELSPEEEYEEIMRELRANPQDDEDDAPDEGTFEGTSIRAAMLRERQEHPELFEDRPDE